MKMFNQYSWQKVLFFIKKKKTGEKEGEKCLGGSYVLEALSQESMWDGYVWVWRFLHVHVIMSELRRGV